MIQRLCRRLAEQIFPMSVAFGLGVAAGRGGDLRQIAAEFFVGTVAAVFAIFIVVEVLVPARKSDDD